jgi:hypothetical protein
MDAVRPADLREVILALLQKAREGDIPAIRELLGRLLGPPVPIDVEDRLTKLEQLLERHHEHETTIGQD